MEGGFGFVLPSLLFSLFSSLSVALLGTGRPGTGGKEGRKRGGGKVITKSLLSLPSSMHSSSPSAHKERSIRKNLDKKGVLWNMGYLQGGGGFNFFILCFFFNFVLLTFCGK